MIAVLQGVFDSKLLVRDGDPEFMHVGVASRVIVGPDTGAGWGTATVGVGRRWSSDF